MTFFTCSYKPLIKGKWRLDKAPEDMYTTMQFKKNGTLLLQNKEETLIQNWDYSHNRRLITISNKDNPESEYFVINYIDPFFMGISNKQKAYTLSRSLKVKSVNHRTARRKLKGTWTLMELDGQLQAPQKMQLSFWDNGVYQQIQGNNHQLGRWILSNDNRKLTLSNDERTQTIELSFTQKSRLQISDVYGSYLLEKKERLLKSPSNKKVAARIVGAWMLTLVGTKAVEDSDYTLYLNEDGSLKIFENNQIAELGKWSVSEDGAFLVLEHSDKNHSYPIESIGLNKLKLKDNFESIVFKRVNMF
jgi:hypothetical protein